MSVFSACNFSFILPLKKICSVFFLIVKSVCQVEALQILHSFAKSNWVKFAVVENCGLESCRTQWVLFWGCVFWGFFWLGKAEGLHLLRNGEAFLHRIVV